MPHGICHLSVIPMRLEPQDQSEIVSQVLFGEHFTVSERRKKWSKIRLAHDKYVGWVDNKQYLSISKEEFKTLKKTPAPMVGDLVNQLRKADGALLPIMLGASLPHLQDGKLILAEQEFKFEGHTLPAAPQDKSKLVETARMYLNAPYLWGGRSVFGIDCSGLTQMVYKLNGYALPRDAKDQAKEGDALSFIEEAEPGDLAFFDNDNGNITHVGIILENNYILHASGKVRLDRLDQTGIFNNKTRSHTHNLRVIKRIIK